MRKPKFRVVDAVMGTGKSTWVAGEIMATVESGKRYVVVLPLLTELERYEEMLKDVDGLVSLRDDTDTGKPERFREALGDASVILITHALFESYLTFDTFDLVRDGEWSLIMDEVVAVFEPVHIVTSTDLAGLMGMGVMKASLISGQVHQLEIVDKMLEWYQRQPPGHASKNQKEILKDCLKKDLLVIINEDNVIICPSFSLNEKRINAFLDVTVLTYPFKNTDLDYWLRIKGYDVDHLRLTRAGAGDLQGDQGGPQSDISKSFALAPHDGRYSGARFKDLIEIISTDQRGKGEVYGDKPNHFSATEYRESLRGDSVKAEGKRRLVKQVLRREFRNNKVESKFVRDDDFMFACPKDAVPIWQDSKNGLPAAFIGANTWVPYNTRATNDHAGKHHLSFLYNVYPFLEVERIIEALGLDYDRERFALYTLIQWIWRSAIRNGERVRLYLPSCRMRNVLLSWLDTPME